MFRFLAIFLIILLPLRGWAGESMAVQMSLNMTSSTTSANSSDMPDDCPMLSQETAAQSQHDANPDKPNCSCQACHLCMPLAFLNALSLHIVSFPPAHQLFPLSFAYVSADLFKALKPPIY